jgi:Na+-driven multidrug efflux pump
MIYIGNDVGEKQVRNVKVFAQALILTWFFTNILISILLILLKSQWIDFYTNNSAV